MPDQKPIDPQRLAEIRIRCDRALADDPRSPIGEDLQDLLAEIDRLTPRGPVMDVPSLWS